MRLRNSRTPLLALCISSILAACGGSSSETPEPERPDAWQLKLRRARKAQEAGTAQERENDLSFRDLEGPTPAKSTWGTNRRRPATEMAPSTATPEPKRKAPTE